jgi:TolB-like protein/Flp pilus assembly protein TadD
MASILPDYEYDIFISYRQNDNKHDGWVSEFVKDLRGELESTFKEEISIYFDENPHDRLQETYNVSKSLEIKLKSFIFIPIVSQTYCDPKSYAWQNELLKFIKMASGDRFGTDIRLWNGNIASRILPVKIRDLEPDDIKLFEKETGSVMRSIDFIFKTPSGVNRPLRVNEDHPNDNLNSTYYRDQINKTANAIKDIFRSVAGEQKFIEREKPFSYRYIPGLRNTIINQPEPDLSGRKARKFSIVLLSVVILTAIVIAIISFIGRGDKKEDISNLEKSIAVLPFRNDSPNDTNTYFINGLMGEVLNHLQTISDLRVISRTSVEQYRNTTKSIPEIAKEQGVNFIVEGSGQKYGNSFTVNVKLIRAVKENQLWSKSYEQEIKSITDIVNVQTRIAHSIVSELKGSITPEEKQRIEKVNTTNLNAYDFYQRGNDELLKSEIYSEKISALENASGLFRKALEFDSTFANAYAKQALVFLKLNYWKDVFSAGYLDSVLTLVTRALYYDDELAEAYFVKGAYYDAKGEKYRAQAEYDKAIVLNPSDWKAYYGKAMLFVLDDPVQYLDYLYIALINNQNDAITPTILRRLGGKLLVTGHIEQAKNYFSKAFELDQDSAFYLSCLGGTESDQGNYEKSVEYFKRAYKNRDNYTEVIYRLAKNCLFTGRYKESLEYFREFATAVQYNDIWLAYAYHQNGLVAEAEKYFSEHYDFLRSLLETKRAYQVHWVYYDLACIYSYRGDKEKALQNLAMFAQNRNSELWMLADLKNDPLLRNIRSEPQFAKILGEMESKFQASHNEVGKWMKDQAIQ